MGTVEELKEALHALKAAAGLRGPKAVEGAAHALGESLPKQTVSDMLAKGRPSHETLATFLRVCRVPREQHAAWQAARGRALGQAAEPDLGQRINLSRVGDADPRDLGVHAAIDVPGADSDLPTYVERDTDLEARGLRARIRRTLTGERGQLLLLAGQSSTGKTRCAYEAIRTLLPHWRLLQPADVEQIRLAAARPPAHLVVWLDELQNHLIGTSGLTPDLVRKLTRSGVLLIATMREEYYRPYARPTRPEDPRGYAAEWEVVRKLAITITIRAKLTVAEQGRVRAAAEHDKYLRTGLQVARDDPFQAIAGVPLLIRHADGADPYARAVLEAAVDAARLGVRSPLSAEFLHQAARGYGDGRQWGQAPTEWFASALDYLRRPLVRTAAVLDAVAPPHTVGVQGFRVSDYLLEKIGWERRFTKVPAMTWRAVIGHVSNPQELVRAAEIAMFLLLYRCAEQLLRRALAVDAHAADGQASEMLGQLLAQQGRVKDLRALAEAGDLVAADMLVQLLVARGRADEAVAVCLRADGGQLSHSWLVANLLLEQGRVEDALSFWRNLADNADTTAADSLAALLADQGRLDDLRVLADDGNDLAAHRLIELLAGQGRIELLRALAGEGFPYAADRLTDLLLQHGTPEEAIAALRAIPPPGRHPIVATRLADLLLEKGAVEEAMAALRALAHTGAPSVVRRLLELLVEHAPLAELRALVDAHSHVTTSELVTLLAEHGRVDDLRALAEQGHPFAAQRLAEALAEQGQAQEAIALVTPVATADRPEALSLLARLLAEQDRLDELCALAKAHPDAAGYRLAELLAEQGRIDGLRDLAMKGHHFAASRLTERLRQQGRVGELRELADAGHHPAAERLAELLAEQGRLEELRELALAGYDAAVKPLAELGLTEDLYRLAHEGHDSAVRPLAGLLAEQGRMEDLRILTEAGHYEAAHQLANLLAERGQSAELRALVDVGAPYAAGKLLGLLRRQGKDDEADMIERFGLPLQDHA